MPIFGKGVASGFPLEVETPQATPAQGTWTPISSQAHSTAVEMRALFTAHAQSQTAL